MPETHPDVVVSAINQLYSWHAPKPGFTIIGAYIGRLLLTSHRLLFLSTGTSGVARALAFNVAGGLPAQLTIGQTRTDELDMSALTSPGSLNLELQRVTRSYVSRRIDLSNYLVVALLGNGGSERFISFMTRYGWNREQLLSFRDSLERVRLALPPLLSHAHHSSGVPGEPSRSEEHGAP